ncbi:MAG: DUF1501 domain-containing protein [Bacteroidetes bacterium]|nr:DUF1501 domain-containing protein [Bacteroidota bacterium]MDA1122199.1 DUF1501 domain-containing protein [Bacteroidota bacterium]
MSSKDYCNRRISRREMLSLASTGFGSVALLGLMGSTPFGGKLLSANQSLNRLLGDKIPHFVPKAKSIIFLYMDGGVSQVDSFDPKPRLTRDNGKSPYELFKVEATQFNNIGKLLKSPWEFKQHGESGMWMSELFPQIATCVDDMAMINSMYSEFPEHTNANYFLHTGIGLQGRPSMGAWVTYGLGSENEDFPGFVVLDGGLTPPGGLDNFKNGFLPATYQASVLRTGKEALANILPNEDADGIQQSMLQYMNQMDRALLNKLGPEDQIESSISNYELAYRMQSSVPELTDISGETKATKKLYGFDSDDKHCRSYAAQCLLARRLVERGVRFIELTCSNTGFDRWDQHSHLKPGHEANAHAVDQPIAGLIKDLKARGLLETTLIIFSGEFGRTPFAEMRASIGRDHNPTAYSMWLAGAGIKGGTVYGKTDDYGYRAVENRTNIHDVHATMLHLLGIDHVHQTYRFNGRDIRLTDVHGHVVHDILA